MNTPAAPTPAKKVNKFISFLDKVGHDFKVGLDKVLPIAATAGEAAMSIFVPGGSALFNQTVAAVITAEQSAAAIGQQSGTGPQKLAAVMQLMGPLIKQALADVGKPNDDASAQRYISSVVTILSAIPAPAEAVAAPILPPVVTMPKPVQTAVTEAPSAISSTATDTAAPATSGSGWLPTE
jgi:hypothetical protein